MAMTELGPPCKWHYRIDGENAKFRVLKINQVLAFRQSIRRNGRLASDITWVLFEV